MSRLQTCLSRYEYALPSAEPRLTFAQVINQKLQQLSFDEVAYLWLADSDSSNYSSAPRKRTDNRVNEGTYGPLSSFVSPFANKSVPEVAEWLKDAPEDVDLDRRFFAVLDDQSVEDGTVLLCRIGDGETEGEKDKVQWYPVRTAGEFFGYIPSRSFDEDLRGYQGKQRLEGKPDRSSG